MPFGVVLISAAKAKRPTFWGIPRRSVRLELLVLPCPYFRNNISDRSAGPEGVGDQPFELSAAERTAHGGDDRIACLAWT
jgi:hypothetical protein